MAAPNVGAASEQHLRLSPVPGRDLGIGPQERHQGTKRNPRRRNGPPSVTWPKPRQSSRHSASATGWPPERTSLPSYCTRGSGRNRRAC